ncbi:hypothetical protein Nocox_20375 [Nonomuraea coxensis DSM 45129]|uniref:Uncharacterized protein n=1 Tax=Nonomuraea coxensis DSM 45129 TaxID=1122611 RepID=A0ABX8U4L8_9ACTN|nr:hypothetical protein [Nonomuraea coxensis]QYC41684.1 hypothetical protein Nocox_20375 [Nonomuraea coxensis DSM 45129]
MARSDGNAFDTATCTYLAALAACTPPATTDSRPLLAFIVAAVATAAAAGRDATTIGWTTIAAIDHCRSRPADDLQLLGFTT